MIKALYLEDDPAQATLMREAMKQKHIDVTSVRLISEALSCVKENDFHIVLADLQLPDGTGTEFVSSLRTFNTDTPVIILTAFPSVDTSVEALRLGVSDYLFKPVNLEQIEMKIRSLCPYDPGMVGADISDDGLKTKLIGQSKPIQELKARIKSVAKSRVNVLINGETGTGKEVCARLIHELSNRADKPFVAVNCASLSPELFVNELFGHSKGSYTGATEEHGGYFAASAGGTLFLDEIGEIDRNSQAKLLRAVETGEYFPVGETKTREVSCRILTATNINLLAETGSGKFRSDLYYRLNVFSINIPPLRSRKEDIPLLSEYFVNKHNESHGMSVKGFTDEAMEKILGYNWPGNVRELENTVLSAMIARGTDYLDVRSLNLAMPTQKSRNEEREEIVSALRASNGDAKEASIRLNLSRSAFYRRTQKYGIKPSSFL